MEVESHGCHALRRHWDLPDETPDAGPANLNHAMVDILFLEGARGGETGTIDADSDPPSTFSGWEAVDQQSVIAIDGFGEPVFPNIDPPSGTLDATVVPSGCFIDESAGLRYPIFRKSITIIYALCE